MGFADSPAPSVLVIGFSAGGLPPFLQLMGRLGPEIPAGIVIAHHATRSFLPDLLPRWTRVPSGFAKNGDLLRSGRAYICPTDSHVVVNPNGTLSLSPKERINFVRPSIDWLFDSASASYGERTIAVLLSGGQNDGALGARRVRERGGCVIVQSPHTATQSSMPRAAAPVASFELDPEELGKAVRFQLDGLTEQSIHEWNLPFGPLPR